eukprot:SAG22_NODE_128_length_18787_cov_19.577108_10_plen_54_part_00
MLFYIPALFPLPDVLSMIGATFILLLLGSASLFHPLGWLLGREIMLLSRGDQF